MLSGPFPLARRFVLFMSLVLIESLTWLGVAPHAQASTVRLGVPSSVANFAQPFTRPGNAIVRFAVFDTLTREDSTGRLGPMLALSWQMEEPKVWVFKLRPGVRFHNGVPFTAQTVADTIKILKTAQGAVFDLASEVAGIARVEPIDEHTVRIITAEPDAILSRRLGLIRMIEPGAWASMGADAYAKAPVGTGPYKVTSWDGNAGSTVLTAAPESWRKVRAIDRVEIRNIPDSTARVQALLSERVDIAFGLSPDDIGTLESGGMTAHIFPGPMVMALTLRNMKDSHPALRDKRVRQALNFAVDKSAISKTIMAGAMTPARGGFTDGTTGFNPALTAYNFDPERARRLLAEAGYPKGFQFVAGVTLGQVPNDSLAFQAVAQDLLRVGVSVELRALTYPDFIERLTTGRWSGIDAFSMLWGAATYADAYRALDRHSCNNPTPYFCDETAMPTLNRVRSIADPSTRERELQAAVATYHELAPAIWLVEYASIVGGARTLQGIELPFEGLYLERLFWDAK